MIPGEAIITAITVGIGKVLEFNLEIYKNADPAKRTELANAILEQNLRAIAVWEGLLTFFKVPLK